MRVLRIYPAANDPRHRKRELALLERGVEVGLLLPHSYGADWNHSPVEPSLPSWRSGLLNRRSIPFHLWDPAAVRRAIREFRPDLVDIHEEPYFPAGAECALLAGSRPVALYTAQNLLKRLPPPVAAMQGWVLGRAAACYPCSSGAASVLRRRGFSGPLDVIPIGTDEELFGVEPKGDRVGFIGRFVPEKGIADLLGFGPRLLCAGEGPLAPDLRAAGAELVRASGLGGLAAALASMGVLVAPSRTTRRWCEQFGRMVVEAMAAGVPVVAYDSGSLPEVVGDAGILVPEGDVAGLHAAVDQALQERDLWAARGRARARVRYTWPAVAERQERLYRAALAGGAAPEAA